MNMELSAEGGKINHKKIIIAVAVILILIVSLYAYNLYLLQPVHSLPIKAGTQFVIRHSLWGPGSDPYFIYFSVSHNNMTLVGAWASSEPVREFVLPPRLIILPFLFPKTNGTFNITLAAGNYTIFFAGNQGTVITVTKTIELIE